MKRKNIHVYETETGALAFFPSAPLVKVGWILKSENALGKAHRAKIIGQLGVPTLLIIFLFVTKYLNVIGGILPTLCFGFLLLAILFLGMFFVAPGTTRYKKSIHGEIIRG